uniref:Anterior pharynx in excess protein 1-like n=1 Tax=Crassostrea virginica TaxID=6565 RepID=A0A8B8CT90_CRAVI|nr:anterior pharynx in excess protein 1-like [Crassostrea virginica]
MNRSILLICLCVVLMAIQVSSTKNNECTKRAIKYYPQKYCSNYSWWNWWCTRHSYRQAADGYSTKKVCCPGWKGSDCSTPICRRPCAERQKCTAPDICS